MHLCDLFSRKSSLKKSASFLLVAPVYTFLHSVQAIQWMTLMKLKVIWSAILCVHFGPEILSMFDFQKPKISLVIRISRCRVSTIKAHRTLQFPCNLKQPTIPQFALPEG